MEVVEGGDGVEAEGVGPRDEGGGGPGDLDVEGVGAVSRREVREGAEKSVEEGRVGILAAVEGPSLEPGADGEEDGGGSGDGTDGAQRGDGVGGSVRRSAGPAPSPSPASPSRSARSSTTSAPSATG